MTEQYIEIRRNADSLQVAKLSIEETKKLMKEQISDAVAVEFLENAAFSISQDILCGMPGEYYHLVSHEKLIIHPDAWMKSGTWRNCNTLEEAIALYLRETCAEEKLAAYNTIPHCRHCGCEL